MSGDERRREALVQAGLTLASELSLPAVLQKIVELACDVADARYGALGVLGTEGRIEDFVTHGITEAERRAIGNLPVGKGILGALITDARPLRLRRIQDDPRSAGFPEHHPRMTTFLGVPITVRGKVYGNLYLTEKRGADAFTPQDEEAVLTLATQAGVAIENARLYGEAQGHRRRLEAIMRVTTAIMEGKELDDVLRLVASSARGLVGADLATIAVPEPDAEHLVLRVAEGIRADALLGVRFASAGSISGEVMRTSRPVMVKDAAGDHHAHQPIVRLGEIGPALFVPLTLANRTFGTLALGNRQGGQELTDQDLALVRVFATQASVALDHARLREELHRLAVLEDRERIAKELHDGVVQSLFAVGMSLQAGAAVADDPDTVRGRLTAAVEDIDRVIRDLRNYIFGLRPGAMADRQLDRALRDLTEDFRRGSDLAMRLQIDPEAAALLTGGTSDLIQAAREAISNAARHAGAETLSLTLTREDGMGVLEIEDDGAGFDVSQAGGKGQGLATLKARAEALGGTLELDSGPGKGTRVRIRVPL